MKVFYFIYFPLIIAAFYFFSAQTIALPADQLPADKKPAQGCQKWHPNGDLDAFGSCDPVAAATGTAYYFPGDWCLGQSKPPGASWSGWGSNDFNSACSFEVFDVSDGVKNVRSLVTTHRSAYPDIENFSGFVKVLRVGEIVWRCPPDGHDDYVDMVEDDSGAKWCLRPADECAEKAGTDAGLSSYLSHVESGVSGRICKSGCEVKPNGVSVCLPWESPSFPLGTVVKCTGDTSFTGGKCGETGDLPQQDGETVEGEKQKPTSSSEDCVLVLNPATGKKECEAVSVSNNPGSQSCGEINGVWSCVDNGDGGSTTTTTKKEQTETTDPETGNTTTTEKTTETTTTCKGADCSSSGKTTTTTTTRGPGGAIIGGSTSCTGAGCAAGAPGTEDGEPEQPGLPDISELSGAIDEFDESARAQIEEALTKAYGDYGESTLLASNLPFSDLFPPPANCVNPVFSTSFYSATFDVCGIAPLINLILSFVCGILTAIHVLNVLFTTVKDLGS